jgi:hypothetical protein
MLALPDLGLKRELRRRRSGDHREQPIDQPVLPGRERGMRGARQPLGQADDVFEPGFFRGNREATAP